MKNGQFEVSGRRVGSGSPCFIIAEAGVNHNGSLDMARKLVDAAATAGADAVKFQTFQAANLATPDAPLAEYQSRNSGRKESQLQMLQRLELDADAHRELLEHCRKRGLIFMSTPFDEPCADLLDDLGVGLFKIPSGEITNLPLLRHVAEKHKPTFISTGMCGLSEVEAAVAVFEQVGHTDFVLLHCVSNYPADPADVNLRAMHTLQAAFQVPVGYSDHSLGIEIGLAAVALGACVLEKHYTLDRSLPGPDHQASLEPDELRRLVEGVRTVEIALGHGRKTPACREAETAAVSRKSLVAVRPIAAGSRLAANCLALRRPGSGLPAAMLPYVLDRSAVEDIPAGTLIRLEMLG